MTDGHVENLGHWLDITVLLVLMENLLIYGVLASSILILADLRSIKQDQYGSSPYSMQNAMKEDEI